MLETRIKNKLVWAGLVVMFLSLLFVQGELLHAANGDPSTDAPSWRLSMSTTRCPDPPGGCYWYCQTSIVNECTWGWGGDCFNCESGTQL
jgi:hypothetical protein